MFYHLGTGCQVSTRSCRFKMKLYKYTEVELKKAVSTCTSYRQVLMALGVKPAGGNYSTLRKAIKYFNLNTSHMLHQRSNKGKTFGPRQDLQVYLSNEKPIQSNKLRKRLLREGLLKHQCSMCSLTDWLGVQIPLELDHIDGNNMNNNFENLRLLCPNCHAMTPTYRGRNIGNY